MRGRSPAGGPGMEVYGVTVISRAPERTPGARGATHAPGAVELNLRTYSVAGPRSEAGPEAGPEAAPDQAAGAAGATVTVVEARGDLDSAAVPRLRDQMRAAGGDRYVAVDVTGVAQMNTPALAVLVGAAKRARAAGGGLVFAGPGETVARILQVTGLYRVIPSYPGLQEALASFTDDQADPRAAVPEQQGLAAE